MFREEDEVDEARNSNENTDLCEFEHRHTIDAEAHQNTFGTSVFSSYGLVLGFLQQHTVDHQVRGRSYQCADTTNDGGIA